MIDVLQLERWAPDKIPDEIAEQLRLIPGYDPIATAEEGDHFVPFLAEDAIHFFPSYLTLTKDAVSSRGGDPFELQPWQRAIVANLFGWMRLDDHGNWVRRYREAFIGVPRKNGKTELTAGIGLLGFFQDDEVGAEVYCAAKDRGQASKLFSAAKLMVLRSQTLLNYCQTYARSLHMPEDGSTFQAISADSERQHGENPHIAIIDEVHVQPNGELIEALETGQASRRQPLIIYLSTSDHDRAGSVCNELWDHAREVRDGKRSASRFLPVLYEADDREDDWRDEKVWARVNPNLGISVSIDYLRAFAQKAEQLPSKLNSFKRLHLDMRTGAEVQAIPMEAWGRCDGAAIMGIGDLTRDAFESYLEGRSCCGGLDLSSKHDMTSFALVFREDRDDGRFYFVLPYFWLPELTIKNPKRDPKKRRLWQQWHREGWLEATHGNVVDYAFVRRRIVELRKRFKFTKIGADPHNAESPMQELTTEGFECEFFYQTHKYLNEASKELEALVVSSHLAHGGHPILREQARVLAWDFDSNDNIKPSRKKSGDKIDGIVATVMGLALAMDVEDDDDSPYEEHGVQTLSEIAGESE